MVRYCTLLCVLVGMFLTSCSVFQDSTSGRYEGKGNVINEISISNDSNQIIIPVTFLEKDYRFLLDTGSTTTVFDVSLKDQLGRRLRSSKARASDGTIINTEFFKIRNADFGGLCRKNIAVATLDLSHASKIAGRRVDGIIGMDILKDHVIRLDFQRNVVSFLRSSDNSEGKKIDLYIKNKRAYLNGKVSGVPVRFLIDTGCVDSGYVGLLESALFEQLDVVGNGQAGQASTVAGPMDVNHRKTTLAELHIGPLEYEDALFVEYGKSILGQYFLSRHVVTFDFPKKKGYLKRIASIDNSSGLSFIVPGFDFTLSKNNSNVVIKSIDVNGLGYKKGFRENDIIMKVNNYDVSKYGLAKFTSFLLCLLEEQELNHLKFLIKRNDKFKEIVFYEKPVD